MNKRHVLAAVTVAAIAGSVVVATNASAAAAPPWETGNTLFSAAPNFPDLDPNSKGGLKFYDATGTEITGGTDLSTIGSFVATTGTKARPNAGQASILFGVPDHNKPNTVNWTAVGSTGSNFFPVSAPGPVLAADVPVASLNVLAGEGSISSIVGIITNDATAGYDHMLQVRLKDSGIGVPTSGLNSPNYYWSADIEYNNTSSALTDGLAAGSWKVIYPVPSVATKTDTTVSSITATPASPAPHGSSVDLSATVAVSGDATTHPTGSVHYWDGSTDLGAATYDTGTGAATFTVNAPADGPHNFVAKFTPTDTATYNPSQSAALSYSVSAVGQEHTSTAISSTSPNGTADATASVSVTVQVSDTDTPATKVVAGTVSVKKGATVLGSGTVDSNGTFTATFTAGQYLSLGSNDLTADYSGATAFQASTTAAATAYIVTAPTAPVSLVAPGISATRVGLAATCTPGAWSGAYAYTYQWFQRATASASWIPVSTTPSTGVLPAAMVGHQVKCTVTAYNPGTATADSSVAAVALGAASRVTVRPKILGTPKVGVRLRAYRGTWSPAATRYLYTWKVGKVVVSRATTWKPALRYKGKYVTVTVMAVRASYLTGTALSARVRIR